MSKPIFQLVDELPTNNLTIFSLKSLDWVVPGEWENLVGFENSIRAITGETDESMIQAIGDRAVYLFNDKSEGYQRALWLYQTIDSTGSTIGKVALANKVGEKIGLLGFLNRITPKADKLQTLDLSLKLVVEILAFCQVNGIPGDSIGDFVASLVNNYTGPSLMRMAALVCFDGLIPLGPDFIRKVSSNLGMLSPQELESNEAFKQINDSIPGNSTPGKLAFIGESFDSVKGWMSDLVASRGLTPQKVAGPMKSFIDFSDDNLDYLAAFLDMSTNYYEHTGIQSLTRSLIERAVAEI
ncbi:hypothetical protein [Oscillatoria sp. FACHB-1406]|uniref:hypothetical protein n=1 Tax=Oscillatoria sp. FACHB-1406 TaxID=2692846 RepID=UPI001686C65C|nr:hypothetical protein [Oscillatoria sp. FACHB-1406]MBD2576918.1 hypothetical protein [Oscillatoria sp. FACHB-1406]